MISNINQNQGGKNEAASAKNFDEEKFYTEEILPLMKLIKAKCESRRIPFLVHVNYSMEDFPTQEKAGCGTSVNAFGRESACASRLGLCGGILSGRISIDDLMAAAAAASKTDVEG